MVLVLVGLPSCIAGGSSREGGRFIPGEAVGGDGGHGSSCGEMVGEIGGEGVRAGAITVPV